jgi:hypothetical protein
MDFEAILPFQMFALILLPFRAVKTQKLVILVTLGIWLAAQPMILIRTCDRGRSSRLTYFFATEIYALGTILAILLVEGVIWGAFAPPQRR